MDGRRWEVGSLSWGNGEMKKDGNDEELGGKCG